MSEISEQRRFLNDTLMPKWASQFSEAQSVLDIGKTGMYNYAPYFKCKYKTLDRDALKKPDILWNMEQAPLAHLYDGIIFNGVFEQCDDPWQLMRNMKQSLNRYGKLLAGLATLGMAPYGESDKWRVTKNGAFAYMKDFSLLEVIEFPAYIFILGEKK